MEEAKVHRVQVSDDSMVLLNFGVIASITLSEGPRTLELEELNRGLITSTRTPRGDSAVTIHVHSPA